MIKLCGQKKIYVRPSTLDIFQLQEIRNATMNERRVVGDLDGCCLRLHMLHAMVPESHLHGEKINPTVLILLMGKKLVKVGGCTRNPPVSLHGRNLVQQVLQVQVEIVLDRVKAGCRV